MSQWPVDFERIPDEPWTLQPLRELAMKYDTVEEHGWYDNLNYTVEQIAAHHGPEALMMDYSGGTGILTDRVHRALGQQSPMALIADSSPKFLRLALEKFKDNPRVAFRLIRYLKAERRLQNLSECLDDSIWERGLDAVVSTNAIHLYYGLDATLQDWTSILRSGGRAYVQSGNINNPDTPPGAWIIDETVEHIHRAAMELVQERSEYADFRQCLNDSAYMEAHDKLRSKYFLPVRHRDFYHRAFEQAGMTVDSVDLHLINARVDDWFDFLAVYHEGALGWIGGAEKITGSAVSEEVIVIRKQLMREGMERIFNGEEEFYGAWTYFQCSKA